jgi:hypothetical protein
VTNPLRKLKEHVSILLRYKRRTHKKEVFVEHKVISLDAARVKKEVRQAPRRVIPEQDWLLQKGDIVRISELSFVCDQNGVLIHDPRRGQTGIIDSVVPAFFGTETEYCVSFSTVHNNNRTWMYPRALLEKV